MPVGAGGALLLLDPWLTYVALYRKTKEVAAGHNFAFVYDYDGSTIGDQYPKPVLQYPTARMF